MRTVMARPALQLVVSVHDLRSGTTVEHIFSRFPVRVGRGADSDLRIDAVGVSRRHAVFRHKTGSPVRYVDLHSTNGSFVDGRRVEPAKPVSLRDSNVIAIGPCQLTFYVRRAGPGDDLTNTLVQNPPGPPPISLGGDVLVVGNALGIVRSRYSTADLWAHALEVMEVLAEMIVLYRRPSSGTSSPLRASSAPDEVVAYLAAPEDRRRRLHELRHVLTDLCQPTTTSPPGARS
jgi:pSer/pThr/pTyr-binding forkhead associated (FHA) protein